VASYLWPRGRRPRISQGSEFGLPKPIVAPERSIASCRCEREPMLASGCHPIWWIGLCGGSGHDTLPQFIRVTLMLIGSSRCDCGHIGSSRCDRGHRTGRCGARRVGSCGKDGALPAPFCHYWLGSRSRKPSSSLRPGAAPPKPGSAQCLVPRCSCRAPSAIIGGGFHVLAAPNRRRARAANSRSRGSGPLFGLPVTNLRRIWSPPARLGVHQPSAFRQALRAVNQIRVWPEFWFSPKSGLPNA
jgi:hypothetical protein